MGTNVNEQKYLAAQAYDQTSAEPNRIPGVGYGSTVGLPATSTVTSVTVRTQAPYTSKKVVEAYLLGIPLGWMGAHQFYLRRPGMAVLYMFTLGLFGVGWVADWFRMFCLVKEANKRIKNPALPHRKTLDDAYILWFPCGLFGFHHFYLRRWGWGVAYLFTFGLLGIGWLIDAFRMPSMVRQVNETIEAEQANRPPKSPKRSLADAYVLCLFPLTGLLGGHHYYLNRIGFGVVYTFTLGLFGIGWIVDWFRLPCLVSSINDGQARGILGDRKKRLDDAYLMLFPLGWLGLHHFYLRRYGWGCLYLFTLGCFGIGWLVDFIRLPCLVAAYNEEAEQNARHLVNVTTLPGGQVTVISTTSGNIEVGGLSNPGYLITPDANRALYPQGLVYPPQGPVGPMPAPPYSAMVTGQDGQPYFAPVHGYPQAGYGAAGQDSWSTIASSDVGHGEMPPTYQESMSHQHDTVQQNAPTAPPPPCRTEKDKH